MALELFFVSARTNKRHRHHHTVSHSKHSLELASLLNFPAAHESQSKALGFQTCPISHMQSVTAVLLGRRVKECAGQCVHAAELRDGLYVLGAADESSALVLKARGAHAVTGAVASDDNDGAFYDGAFICSCRNKIALEPYTLPPGYKVLDTRACMRACRCYWSHGVCGARCAHLVQFATINFAFIPDSRTDSPPTRAPTHTT